MATETKPCCGGAQSLKCKSFTTLCSTKDGVLNDDYIHGTFETWKIKGKTDKGGEWEYKGKVKDLNKGLESELKIKFPYSKYWFWLGVRSCGDVKIHCDLGKVQLLKKDFNLFTNVKTNAKFSNFEWRVGSNHSSANYECNTRLEQSGTTYQLTQRNWFRRNNFFGGLVGTVALDKLNLKKFDGILGWEKDNANLYLTFKAAPGQASCHKCPCPPGTATLTAVWTKGDNTFGGSFSHGPNQNHDLAVAVSSKLKESSTLKAKLNQNLDLALVLKHKWSNTLNITASALLELKKGAKMVDCANLTPVPLGVQFDLNI